MVASYKAVGAVATTTVTSMSVPLPAVVAGDYAVMDIFVGGSSTPPTVPGWTLAWNGPTGSEGRHIYWKAFTGTASATTVSVTGVTAGGAYAKVAIASSAGNTAPTVFNNLITNTYWQSGAITLSTARLAFQFGFIDDARTQGSLSNQGTITSTNTSRVYDTVLSAYRLQVVSSAITSASGGSVRGTFTGGSTTSDTVTIIIPEPGPATPTSLAVTAGDTGELDISFGAVSGADSYQIRYRQTGLTPPSSTTQTSAPAHLTRVDDATPGEDTTYVYTWNGAGVTICALDTGIRATHVQFAGVSMTGATVGGGSTPWNDDSAYQHGTGTASVAVGSTSGVAKGSSFFEAKLDPVGWTPDLGAGGLVPVWVLEDARDAILAHLDGAHAVLYLPLSFLIEDDGTAIRAVFQSFEDAGVMVLLSAGNSSVNMTGTAYGDTWYVGATETSVNNVASYSNYGNAVAIYAPSGSSTNGAAGATSDTATSGTSGTSEASPMVAGVMAKNLQANSKLSPARLREVLLSQARYIVTSPVASGLPMLNSDSIITEWSIHDMSGTSGSLDGLGDSTGWEVQVRTIDGGIASDWSTTASATTIEGATGLSGKLRIGGETLEFTSAACRVGGATVSIIAGGIRISNVTVPFGVALDTTSLRLEWGLNEGTGTSAADSSGNGHAATVVGWETGHTSFGAKGDASHAACSYSGSVVSSPGGITFMFWYYPTRSATNVYIAAVDDSGDGYLAVEWKSTTRLVIDASPPESGSPADYNGASVDTPLNTWVHVAMTWAGSTLTLWLNGVARQTTTISGTKPNINRVSVGGDPASSSFDVGTVDDIRLFDTALSGTDINTWMGTPIT